MKDKKDFASNLKPIGKHTTEDGTPICYNGNPCVKNCNLDTCPVTGKYQD